MPEQRMTNDSLLILNIDNLSCLLSEIYKKEKSDVGEDYKLFEDNIFTLAVRRIVSNYGIIIRNEYVGNTDYVSSNAFIHRLYSIVQKEIEDALVNFLMRLSYREVAYLKVMIVESKLYILISRNVK